MAMSLMGVLLLGVVVGAAVIAAIMVMSGRGKDREE